MDWWSGYPWWAGTYLVASEELFSLLASSADNDGNDKDEYEYKN